MFADNSKYTLTYFDARGKAELIRILLTWGGQEFIDKRISREEWIALKPSVASGQLPLLEEIKMDGTIVAYSESGAITRALAKKYNLMGSGSLEDYYTIELICGIIADLSNELIKIYFAAEEKKPAMITETFTGKGKQYLSRFVSLLKATESHFFLGNVVSLADIAVMALFDFVDMFSPKHLTENYPDLVALKEHVLAKNAKVAEYFKTRK